MIVFNIIILVIQDKTIAFTPPDPQPPYVPQPGEVLVTCEKCGWKNYYTSDRARRGIAGHRNWCNREH